ncbi:MAG TPA: glycoside hydrolase family 30 beta sandwich domain-containing protein [Terracidiphilus sp.]|jgi:glucosylceramidase
MAKRSRRNFLKAATAAAAALTITGRTSLWGAPASSPVRVWSTHQDKRHAAGAPLQWKSGEAGADAIVLDAKNTKQEILGFGAAMTDASCYVLSRMKDAERQELMHDLFAPEGMALNVCRTCIGASDYSRDVYSFDESTEPDPEMKKFSIEHDKAYILPMLREARKANPELFLFSSPWSPPAWMKPNNSMLGGAMRKLNFKPYALYFQKFLEGYKADGVLIDAVTVQNETDAEQEGRMPACLWSQEQEIEFVKGFLGPAIKKAALTTKIWVLDHNYSLWGRALDELSDPEAYEYIDGIAWHGYVGNESAMTRVHDAFPKKSAYWTEGGPDISQPDYQTDWSKWAESFNGILNNWSRSITSWNLALDEKGNPNIGPFPCGGVVTIDNATHKVTQSGQYWAFAHYSKHVQRGAKVIASGPVAEGAKISHVAFRNPDGGYVLVVANRGKAEKNMLVKVDENALELKVAGDSVHTLEWA